jgi:hypothetical protein
MLNKKSDRYDLNIFMQNSNIMIMVHDVDTQGGILPFEEKFNSVGWAFNSME